MISWGNLSPRPLILFKRFNTAPLHSFKLIRSKFKLRNFRCHVSWKRIKGALNLYCSSSKIVWWLPIFDFGIFCHLLRLMGIYRVGAPSGYLKSFALSFLFFPFSFSFSFLFFVFFFFLALGGPLNSGAPGHRPPMPPSCYATDTKGDIR